MANIHDDYIIPRASSIDYSNAAEVEGYALYLTKLYESEGGFTLPHRATPLMRTIESELRIWCEKVRHLLSEAPLTCVATLIKAYNLPCRVAFRKAPARDFMRKIRISAVQRWAKGDKTISSTALAEILSDEINSSDYTTLENKYGMFYFGLIKDWVKELQCSGTFVGISKVETYIRLKLIMDEELFGEYGSNGAEKDKCRWADNHLVDDLSTLDTATLRAYIGFVMAYTEIKSVSAEEYSALYKNLFTELKRRQDINRYLRSSLTIDLAIKNEAMKEVC